MLLEGIELPAALNPEPESPRGRFRQGNAEDQIRWRGKEKRKQERLTENLDLYSEWG